MTNRNDTRLGKIIQANGKHTLRFERFFSHPIDKVWSAITESEHLNHWFPADIIGNRVEGSDLKLRFWPETVEHSAEEIEEVGADPEAPSLPGKLLTWDPPHVFEFTWSSDLLRFELESLGSNTRLTFTTIIGDDAGPHGIRGKLVGYHVCLDSLIETLDNGSSSMPAPETIELLSREYSALAD